MTLANCQRLLKHYNDLADGTIPAPKLHKNWHDVVANAKVRSAEMEKKIARKLTLPQYAHMKEKPKVVKADAKK